MGIGREKQLDLGRTKSSQSKWLKKKKRKRERHRAKDNPECIDEYRKFSGYE